MIDVLIVDDHRLVRAGLARMLADAPDIEVVGEVGSGEAALSFIRQHAPEVVLMDVRMPGIGGLEATRRAVRIDREVKVIAVSMCEAEPYPSQLLRAGAAGYLSKGADVGEVVRAIRRVASGDRYVSNPVAQHLALAQLDSDSTHPFDVLSGREMQIALMVVNCVRVQEISRRLHLSPKTVNSYRYRIFDKLGVGSDVQLTRKAIREGIIDRDELPEAG